MNDPKTNLQAASFPQLLASLNFLGEQAAHDADVHEARQRAECDCGVDHRLHGRLARLESAVIVGVQVLLRIEIERREELAAAREAARREMDGMAPAGTN